MGTLITPWHAGHDKRENRSQLVPNEIKVVKLREMYYRRLKTIGIFREMHLNPSLNLKVAGEKF